MIDIENRFKTWLKGEFAPLVDHYLGEARIRQGGIFEPSVVQRLRQEHWDNKANHSHLLWALLLFEQWRERWGVQT